MSIDPFEWMKGKIENRDYPSIGFYQWHASLWKMLAIMLVVVICFGWSYTLGSAVNSEQISKIVHADVQTQMSDQMRDVRQTLSNINAKLGELSDAQKDQAKDLKKIMNKPQYAPRD